MRITALVLLLGLSFSATASLIDNGSFTTDPDSGLDWLDLSETAGLSWQQAKARLPDWRPATAAEIKGLHAQLFPGYNPADSKMESLRNGYPNQLNDIHAFNALFGYTFRSDTESFTLGLYRTPEGDVTTMGAREVFSDGRMPHRSIIFGPKYRPYEPDQVDTVIPHMGVFMVRPAEKAGMTTFACIKVGS